MATLFREQNLERVKNPDALDDYIRIANPGVWMVLGVICLLLVAAIVWTIFGEVDITTPGYLVVQRGASTLWLPEDQAQTLSPGSEIQAANATGMVTSPAGAPEAVSELKAAVNDGTVDFTRYGQWVCPFSASINLPTGSYPAVVTTESYSPWQLIFGGAQATAETSNQTTAQPTEEVVVPTSAETTGQGDSQTSAEGSGQTSESASDQTGAQTDVQADDQTGAQATSQAIDQASASAGGGATSQVSNDSGTQSASQQDAQTNVQTGAQTSAQAG